jgi:hypothetical protein
VLVAGDVGSAAHCRAVLDKAVKELAGIDILVNNAAHQATFKSIEDISDEEWEMTFRVNIHAMFYLTKAAVPHMKNGSAIINTASINADTPNPLPMLRPKAQFKTSPRALRSCSRKKAFVPTRSHPAQSGRR